MELLQPESSARIVDVFGRLGLFETDEIMILYTRLGGMPEMDDQFWRLWPLDEVMERNEGPSSFGVCFSDYLIDSWCFRVRAAENGAAEVLADGFSSEPPLAPIASSLREFFAAYVENAQKILCAT